MEMLVVIILIIILFVCTYYRREYYKDAEPADFKDAHRGKNKKMKPIYAKKMISQTTTPYDILLKTQKLIIITLMTLKVLSNILIEINMVNGI